MKQVIYFVTLFYLLQQQGYAQAVLPFSEQNKVGIIDTTGAILIPAKFYQIGQFVDGLAPARLQGLYGYIDLQGTYIIPPIYDYAEPFNENRARVWQNGKLLMIDRQGKYFKAFEKYDGIGDFKNGMAITYNRKTKNTLQGLVDTLGNTIFPPIYDLIRQVTDTLFVVEKDKEVALMTNKHQVIVPFGKYNEISFEAFNSNYFYASYCANKKRGEDCDSWDCFVDTQGKEVFKKQWKDTCFLSFDARKIQSNMIKLKISKKQLEGYNDSRDIYVNLANEKVIDNPDYIEIGNFCFGKTFAKTIYEYKKGLTENRFILIDQQGKQVGNYFFDDVEKIYPHNNSLIYNENGLAIIKKNYLYGIIDTAGKLLVAPKFEEIDRNGFKKGYLKVRKPNETVIIDRTTIVDNTPDTVYHYLPERYITIHANHTIDTLKGKLIEEVFEQYEKPLLIDTAISDDYNQDYYEWGLIDTKGKWVLPPSFVTIEDTPISTIWIAQQKDTIGYINSKGRFIWSVKMDSTAITTTKLDTLNLDYKGSAYYSAYSTKGEESNGWAVSKNLPKQITAQVPTNVISLVINTKQIDTLRNYAYYAVQLNNNTQDTSYFYAADSRLPMILEAQNEQGVWVAVQEYAHSWCGNSYHTLQLAPKEYWSLKVPLYKGCRKTKFRLAVEFYTKNKKGKKKFKVIYSNEYEGSINPAQFWRLAERHSNNLMNPY